MPTKKNKARYKIDPQLVKDPRLAEVKSERVTLLISPSLKDEAKAAAAVLKVSLNEFCNQAIAAQIEAVTNKQNDVTDNEGAGKMQQVAVYVTKESVGGE